MERDFDIAEEAISHVRKIHNFKILAWVVLPNHLHILITPRSSDYSVIVSSLKRRISWKYRDLGLLHPGEKLWQDRFWEHTIKDDDDRLQCVEYIHYSPVKHGCVKSPVEWKHSSFGRYIERGLYAAEWGEACDLNINGAEYD